MNQSLGLSQKGVLQQIIDNLPAVVFEYTIFPDGSRDFTYLSPRCDELLGLKREVLLSGVIPMKEFIHEDDWQSLERSVEQSIKTLQEFAWEGRVYSEDELIWIEAKGTPIMLENNSIVCSGIMSNISHRKRAEERERQLETDYKKLLEFLPLGIAIHTGGKIIYANRYAADTVGAKNPDELIGRPVIDFIAEKIRPMVFERIKNVLNGIPAPQIEEKYVRLDGSEIDVLSSALPARFAGAPAVLNIFINVTEQKEAAAAIKKSETLFTQLFQNTPLAIVLLDPGGCVADVNHGFEEMFGYSRDELKGRNLEQFIVPKELTDQGSDLNSLISSKKVIRLETVRMSKDRGMLSVIIYGMPVKMENETIGIFGAYVDITEGKRVEEELKVRNTELDNFVYKVSHDLRAPLSSILGLVNLAGLEGNNDSLEDYLQIIGKKANQLDHFIGDVLSHSKNLKMQVRIGRVDFNSVIEEAFSELTYLKGSDVTSKEISVSGVDFNSDLWRIKEIFRNLISNAIKYRNQKLSRSLIGIKIDVTPAQATVVFSDNGVGISEDQITNIFEMFYRASEVSEGSGLGLYIVKNAIEKLNGTIEVESQPEKGTTFKIMLPNQQLD
ncbi:MAG: PAS domain-containing sensor histidine kinase [Cyclobacteriaceae bacterium]|nr:PAS domain-containing sensor histidine kinase [Cyclobacteriaceae bacterium]